MADITNKKTGRVAAAIAVNAPAITKPTAPKVIAEKAVAPAIQVKTPTPAAAIAAAPPAVTKPAAPKVIAEKAAAPAIQVKTPTPAAPTIAAAPKQGAILMNDTLKTAEATIKTATVETAEKATAMLKDMNTRAKAAFEKSGEVAKDVVEFNKANLEAIVESAKIAAKGGQTAAQTVAELTRKNFEATTAMLKSAAAVKSPTDFFKLQGDFARSQFDGVVAEMSKSSEFYLKLAGEVFQPIQHRYTAAAEQVKARMAA
jgi:phasin family protein